MTREAKIIQIIATVSITGKGIDNDPIREVTKYWSLEGELIAEVDNWIHENERNR